MPTTKADFNAEEWSRVTLAPALAGLRVVAASRGGTVRESVGLARAYGEARAHPDTPLLGEIIASPPQLDPAGAGSPEDVSVRATAALHEAIGVLEARAEPAEVDAYRHFVRDVALAVARAHKEGGVLGIGGQEVSDAERAALEEIDRALGGSGGATPPPAA